MNKAGERVFAWRNRGKLVALDVARAIAFLHAHRTTHFDIKVRCALLQLH